MAGQTSTDPLHDEILKHHDKVLIVDFGSQVTQLIARRVREAGVYCEIAPFQTAERAFAELNPKAVILLQWHHDVKVSPFAPSHCLLDPDAVAMAASRGFGTQVSHTHERCLSGQQRQLAHCGRSADPLTR